MGFVTRIDTWEKVSKRVKACREADMKVTQNFISGLVLVEAPNGDIVLKCAKQDGNMWKLDYNEQYWTEVPR